jgi:EmrB/QacA subfamily drug resistance transporter
MHPRSRSTASFGALLALFGLASLITALDFTIVYVALPEIARDLEFSPHASQWIISAYAISFGGPLLLAGRLGDLIGRRRIFLIGMALFTAGSILGGLATQPGTLIGARIVQGLGAAALFPSTLALIHTTFAEGAPRDRAVGLWAAAGAAGLSLGALLGGVLTDAVGWRGVFFVNVPLTVLGLLAGLRLLAADPAVVRGRRFDLSGAVTGTSVAALSVFVVARGPHVGWTNMAVMFAAVAAVVLLAGFITVEAKTRQPLLPLSLFRNINLRITLCVILIFGMTLNAVPYVLTQYFQSVLGYDPLGAGLGFLVPTATIATANLLGERLVARFRVRSVLIGGLALGAAGAMMLASTIRADGSYLAALPGLTAYGLGLGAVFPAMFIAASTDIPARDSGIASGLASTMLQIGTAAGLAVLVGVVAGELSDGVGADLAGGLRTGLYIIAAGALLISPLALLLPGSRPTAPIETAEPSAASRR